MLQPSAVNSISAVSAAVLVASLTVLFTSGMPEAEADAQAPALHQIFESSGKSDRLPVLMKATGCAAQNWPYLDESCRSDTRDRVARTVRVIALR